MNLFSKIAFLKQRPKIVATDSQKSQVLAGLKVLGQNEILVLELKEQNNLKELDFFTKNASLSILVLNSFDSIEKAKRLLNVLPISAHLIFNNDISSIQQLAKPLTCFKLSYGLEQGAQLRATDFYPNGQGTHFKLNFKGNILPVWLPQAFSKQTIYNGLVILAIAQILNLNLVETSSKLKQWQFSTDNLDRHY